jgi:ankyrin repeat protein
LVKKDLEAVRSCLESGVSVNGQYQGREVMNPLEQAVAFGTTEIVKLLIDSKANVDAPADENALAYGILLRKFEAIECLIRAKANVNLCVEDVLCPTALHVATRFSTSQMIMFLIGNGAAPSLFVRNSEGKRPHEDSSATNTEYQTLISTLEKFGGKP